jgi:hypothetical protein
MCLICHSAWLLQGLSDTRPTLDMQDVLIHNEDELIQVVGKYY